ncbi:MAG: UbiA family prenyltransferase [Lentimicrobium sp.]
MNVRGLFHSNLIVSLAAVSLMLATQVQLGLTPAFHFGHILVFGACMTEYQLHRLLKFYSTSKTLSFENYKWISDNLVLTWIYFLAPLLIVLVSFFYVNAEVKQIFLASAFITLLYSVPLNGWGGYLSLRKVPLLKTFLVAFVWSAVTVLIPAACSYREIPAGHISWIFAGRSLLIFSLALLFDERDADTDRKNGIKTIPNIFGRKTTHRLVVLLLFLFVTASLAKTGFNAWLYPFVSALLIAALLTLLMFCRRCRTNLYFYNVFLDGSLIIYSLLVIGGWLLYSVA